MLPILPRPDGLYAARGYVEPIGKRPSAVVGGSNKSDVFFRQQCKRAVLSVLGLKSIPTLLHHVLDILALGSKKKMRRLAANWIVAFVTNKKTPRYRSNMKLVGKPVGVEFVSAPVDELTIPSNAIGDSRPGPAAGIRNLYVVSEMAIRRAVFGAEASGKEPRSTHYASFFGLLRPKWIAHVVASLLVASVSNTLSYGQALVQSGSVTPGHVGIFITNGVMGDGGVPGGPIFTGSTTVNDFACVGASGTIIDCGLSATGTNGWTGLQNFNGGITANSATIITEIISGLLTINNNSITLPAGAVGTLAQLGGADNVNSFIYYDAFGVSGPHNSTPHIVFRTNRGTNASPSAVGAAIDNTPALVGSTGDYFGALFGLGYQNGGAYETIAPTALAFRPAQLQTPTAQGSRVQIAVTPNNSATGYYAFTFDQSGTFIVNNTITVAPPTPVLGAALTPVQLVGAIGNQGIELDSAAGSNFIFGVRSDGTPGSRTAVAAASGTLQLGGLAFDGTTNNTVASLDFFTLNLQSLTDHSGFFRFRTVPSGSTTIAEAMRIQASGGVSVGTTTDPGIGKIGVLTAYNVGSNQVVGARVTGYTAMTGTPDKATAYATSTVTLAQLAGRMMQLQADLTTHGLIGP